jgi:predicted transposase YbfD/YdcC
MTTPLSTELAAPVAESCVGNAAIKSIPSLAAYLARVPDHRGARGKRHPLTAVLLLICCALLCGVRSLQAVADWGRDHPEDLATSLGFTRPRTPCGATLHNLVKKLDWAALEQQLRAWAQAAAGVLGKQASRPGEPTAADPQGAWGEASLAIDGKTLRGARRKEAAVAALVSAFGHRLGLTLGVGEVSDGDEIAAVRQLLLRLGLKGKVVTLDALHTQEETARQIVAGGGDYVMVVKGNQPQLQAAICRLLSSERTAARDLATAQEQDESHGRQHVRWLQAVSVSEAELAWPGAAQVFVLARFGFRDNGAQPQNEVVYGVTSWRRESAAPNRLLQAVRGHWSIENRSHWVRDVTFGEDASLAAAGRIPQTLALLRTLALNCLRLAGARNVARETRRLSAQPWRCLRLLGIPAEN